MLIFFFFSVKTVQVDLQSVRDSVKYCCFLLEAEVTDSALLALSKEILSGKVMLMWWRW